MFFFHGKPIAAPVHMPGVFAAPAALPGNGLPRVLGEASP
jgi:hypothetical protein